VHGLVVWPDELLLYFILLYFILLLLHPPRGGILVERLPERLQRLPLIVPHLMHYMVMPPSTVPICPVRPKLDHAFALAHLRVVIEAAVIKLVLVIMLMLRVVLLLKVVRIRIVRKPAPKVDYAPTLLLSSLICLHEMRSGR
jgi:hypothetical protein